MNELKHNNRVAFAQPQLIEDFEVNIPQPKIDEIIVKVTQAKLPKQMPPAEGSTSFWQSGMNVAWLSDLQKHWITEYDWRKAEAKLNSYPQYKARIDSYDIQFYYIVGEGINPRPLLITHGWPGSAIEFFEVIGPLTEPSKYGGNAQDAFTLIIPAIPGYGFSSMPTKPISAITTATLWNKLMTEVIGHKTYFAQGGDIGSMITTHLAYLYPEEVRAIHLNMAVIPLDLVPTTEAEKKWVAEFQANFQADFDYLRMQANKPMMPAVALTDSPLGTAAWIAEKFWAWTDNKGDLNNTIGIDDLLTNIMLYLVNEAGISGSFWFYRGFDTEMHWQSSPGYVKVPTAIAEYPKEFLFSRPPLETAQRFYNVQHFKEMPKGGHFAAMEQPQLFVEDLRNALLSYPLFHPATIYPGELIHED